MSTLNVSVVVATRNRCPFPVGDALEGFNPLRTCLLTLAGQRVSEPFEVVVVDDASTDATPAVVASLYSALDPAGVPLRYLRSDERLGPALARRAGARWGRGEIVLFMDDDCLLPPTCVDGAVAALRNGAARRVGMVGLPCYYRAPRPSGSCPSERIGRLSLPETRWEGNFDRLPADWPEETGRGDGLLWEHDLPWSTRPPRCLDVDWCLMGCSVTWRHVVFRARALPEFLRTAWWAEALEASVAISQAGFRICFTPEPALGVCHLKFGTRGRYSTWQRDWDLRWPGLPMRLGKILAVAEEPRPGSGVRTAPAEFFHHEILGYFAFLLRRNVAAANAWALREYQRFVIDGHVHHQSMVDAPESAAERHRIWRAALLGGLDCGPEPASPDLTDRLGSALRSLLSAEPLSLEPAS